MTFPAQTLLPWLAQRALLVGALLQQSQFGQRLQAQVQRVARNIKARLPFIKAAQAQKRAQDHQPPSSGPPSSCRPWLSVLLASASRVRSRSGVNACLDR